MTKIVIAGSRGRMGEALLRVAPQIPEIKVVGEIGRGDNLEKVISQCDVVIDFSFHRATFGFAELCAKNGKALVIGTSGHTDEERNKISSLQSEIPIVWSSNYSTGVNTLFWLSRTVAETLGASFDIEILEMHHRHKKDAPSGTAKTFFEILSAARKELLKESEIVAKYGRNGISGERDQAEIGIHSMRGGDVVCDHTVIFAAPGERVELMHSATNRETFARGALRAATWVAKQKPGLYDMLHVLGLSSMDSQAEDERSASGALHPLVTR